MKGIKTNNVQPHSSDAEKGVLSSMLQSPQIAIEQATSQIDATYFYEPIHQTLFNLLVELQKNGKGLDAITFTQALRDRNLLEGVGGPGYVMDIQTFAPPGGGLDYYLPILHDKRIRRQIILDAERTKQAAYREEDEISDIVGKYQKRASALNGLLPEVQAQEPEPEKENGGFPVHGLPENLRDIVLGTAEQVGNVTMSGVIGLSVISAALGKGLVVEGHRGKGVLVGKTKCTPGNIFVLVSKDSTSGGSETATPLMKPFTDEHYRRIRLFDEKEKPQIEGEMDDIDYLIDELKRERRRNDLFKERRDEIKAEIGKLIVAREKLKERVALRMWCSNVTSAALTARLARGDETIFHQENDAGNSLIQLVGGVESQNESAIVCMDQWLKGFNWEPTENDRVTSGSQQLKAPCITLLMIMTPEKADKLYRDERLIQAGFLPRCLIVDPQARPEEWTKAKEARIAGQDKEVTEKYHAVVAALLKRFRFFYERREENGEKSEPYIIKMTEEAKQIEIDDYNRTVRRINALPSRKCAFLGRRNELAIRIAVVLHACKHIRLYQDENGKWIAEAYGHTEKLDAATMRAALELMDFFEHHQQEFRHIGESKVEDERVEKIRKLIVERGGFVTQRELYRGRRVFDSKEVTVSAMAELVKSGAFDEVNRHCGAAGGRPSLVYTLPPKIAP